MFQGFGVFGLYIMTAVVDVLGLWLVEMLNFLFGTNTGHRNSRQRLY